MKRDILTQYKAARTSLRKERAKLQTRLSRIEAVLGAQIATPLPALEAEAPVRRRRRVSAAGRAALRAAARARWAAYRARKAGKAAPKRGRKAKKYFSRAARAALSAAAKARWARVKAAGRSRL